MCQWAWFVAVGFEKRDKLIIGDASGLGEPVHPRSNFDVHVAIVK